MYFFTFFRIIANKLPFKVARFNSHGMLQEEIKGKEAPYTEKKKALHKIAVRKTVYVKRDGGR